MKALVINYVVELKHLFFEKLDVNRDLVSVTS